MGAAIVAVIVFVGVISGSAVLVRRVRNGNVGGTNSSGRIDSFTVGEPWRRHVAAAQSAQRRYRTQVVSLPTGPLRARMAQIGLQVDRGVMECWEIAKRGHQLDRVIRDLNAADLQARLDKSRDQREGASLRAQLASVDRIRTARNDADERLRVLQTRLGELIGQAAEVAHDVESPDAATASAASMAGSSTDPGELGSAVDDVVAQLAALRLAIREVNEPMVGLGGVDGGTAASTG